MVSTQSKHASACRFSLCSACTEDLVDEAELFMESTRATAAALGIKATDSIKVDDGFKLEEHSNDMF